LSYRRDVCRHRLSGMDIVAIALGLVAFAVLFFLIDGIDRI
jgi:hypothetical protein